MSVLTQIIEASDREYRDRALDTYCRDADLGALVHECEALESLRRSETNLYARVRAFFFLYAIHRFHLPTKPGFRTRGFIPFEGYAHLLKRRYEEAIEIFLRRQASDGPNDSISSALAAAYRSVGFQTLADQVRSSVRSVPGNQWMFRIGHPEDHPLRVRPELLIPESGFPTYPILNEATPVRMDMTHCGWSDIFFLGMDYPEGARVLNVSIDLSVRSGDSAGTPRPPVETFLRVIDRPVLRLVSVDLGTSAELDSIAGVFDFAADYLGLLKAGIIAAGVVPPGMEGANQPLRDLLARLTRPGLGLELITRVNGIPKGSRLAVSTTLLSSIIAVCMRATGQTASLVGSLNERERRLVAARAILGEWLGGSGGGWQDSGGVWPGIKLISGVVAGEGESEFGISRGCLLPQHRIFTGDEVPPDARKRLQQSLVLVHGGMAQDVGPVLEMVTEKYLLRSEREWRGRGEALRLLDTIIEGLKRGDIREIGGAVHRNFDGPIQTIIPWANNLYTETLIARVRAEFKELFIGFWMLGGMSGGGMGFIFDPTVRERAAQRLQGIMSETKKELETGIPFAMEPVVYDFAINERGTIAEFRQGETALLPEGYYTHTVPALLRVEPRSLSPAQRAELERFSIACRAEPEMTGVVERLFDHILPQSDGVERKERELTMMLEEFGFDRIQHEQIRADLRGGRIGLAQNRLPISDRIDDVAAEDVFDTMGPISSGVRSVGMDALAEGAAAVVTLAAGAGSRWTKGAGTVKALHPFCRLGGKYRTFLETHIAKSRRTGRLSGTPVPHIVTTGYLTHGPIEQWLKRNNSLNDHERVLLSPGWSIGLRMVPMVRDLRFAWEEQPQQMLDVQAQKVLESLHASLIDWASRMGEASDYTDNLPSQCLHPVGHWYEIANLLRNGVLHRLLGKRPRLQYLMIHNIDTVGADLDPALLGFHIDHGATITTEVTTRRIEDRGGGLARINGKVRLIEGLALPREELEFSLSHYNSATYWVHIDRLLAIFTLGRDDLGDQGKVAAAVRALALRMPTYITLKDVKKRWGKGQEDIYPTCQFERLWGDMTALPELDCRYVIVSRSRGQQLKEPAQLDGWSRDGSAEYVNALCTWE